MVLIVQKQDVLAMLEVDLNESDYLQAAGINQGKIVRPIGSNSALVRDFDPENNILSYITDPGK